MFLASAVRAAGFSPLLRQRMSPELLVDQPFRQLARVAEQVREHAESARARRARPRMLQEAQYLRALLDICRRCAASVHEHLEAHGVSVDVVFEVDQLLERTHRIDAAAGLRARRRSPGASCRASSPSWCARPNERRSDPRPVLAATTRCSRARWPSAAPRPASTTSAATAPQYLALLRAAVGGGAVLGLTTFVWFFIVSSAWARSGAASSSAWPTRQRSMLIQLLGFTVATKQPAMTAPALADKLDDVASADGIERFVDEVAHLIRSQSAGIIGNLLGVVPVVLRVQALARLATGAPLVDADTAVHVLEALTLLGPTPFYAACTGVLLFASALIAGWVENWFVWHRLDSAIAWNPRIVARLGAGRARRWSRMVARQHLRRRLEPLARPDARPGAGGGVVLRPAARPAPRHARHRRAARRRRRRSARRRSRAASSGGASPASSATGALNLGVSFFLAFRVALRSRGIRVADRSRIHRAIRARLRRRPLSFLLPPRPVPVALDLSPPCAKWTHARPDRLARRWSASR